MLTIIDSIRNTMCNAIVDSVDSGGAGTIEIRSGTRPALPTDTATGTLLATVALAATAFGAAATGSATIVDPAGVTAAATGTATWFRAKNGSGTAQFDGKVGATGDSTADLTLSSTSVVSGTTVDITGGTIAVPQGTVP